MLTATLSFTPELVRAATLAYVRRGIGFGGAAAFLALLGAAAFLVALRPASWLSGMATGAVLVLAMLVAGLYLLHYRQGLARLRRMGSRTATLELTEAALRVTSDAGSFSAAWSTFPDLWQFPEFWLLIIGRGQFMTLPLAGLSPEARAFIASHVPTTNKVPV